MLLSVCAVLKESPEGEPSFLGRAAHATFLSLIARYEPELARKLHDQEGRKPFTTSPLLRNKEGEYFRFTTYSPSLSQLLLDILTKEPPPYIDGGGKFIPIAYWCVDNSWQGETKRTTYYELISRWLSGRNLPKSIKLKFFSPTTFRSGGKTSLCPWGRSKEVYRGSPCY